MNGSQFIYLKDEGMHLDSNIDEKYPYKAINMYEEDGVGKVCYYVLQRDTPKKVIAKHIFKDNPQIQKVYMALRDWVSYNLAEDIKYGRQMVVYDRSILK